MTSTQSNATDIFSQALAVAELHNVSGDLAGPAAVAFAIGHMTGQRVAGWKAYDNMRDMVSESFSWAYDRGFQAGSALRPRLAWEV